MDIDREIRMSNLNTTRKLQQRTRYWQKEMKLHGWDIESKFVNHPNQLENEAADAETLCLLENQSAAIKIVRQKHNAKPVEQRLIHELIHARIPLTPTEETASKILEAGIDALADLIYIQAEVIRKLCKQ